MNAALARLSRNGLAFATVHSYANLYRINRDHVLWPAVEIALNAPNELRSRIRRFGEQDGPPGVTVLLYGSVERGDATPDSDVDLVVIAPDDTPASEFEDFVYELGNRVRAWTGNQSQVISLTSSQLADSANRGDPLIDTWTSASEVLLGEIKTEAR